MFRQCLQEGLGWFVGSVLILLGARALDAAVDCVSGCNHVRAVNVKNVQQQDMCLVYSEPQGRQATQVQQNLGGMPVLEGNGNDIAYFTCPTPCTEVCNPPRATHRELEPPEDMCNCTQEGKIGKMICKKMSGD